MTDPKSPPRLFHEQVVRYSALVGGIGYGIVHRRTLQAKEDVKAAARAYQHKEHLIEQAKKAYRDRLLAQKTGGAAASGGTC